MTQSSVTPSPRYTFQRNSLYYFRYTLPPDISKVVGKQGLRYSLKTGYIKQAERKARRLAGTVEEFLWKLKVKFENSDQWAEASEKLQANLELE